MSAKKILISRALLLSIGVCLLAACVSQQSAEKPSKKILSNQSTQWKVDELAAALAAPSRPQEDRDRDINRKPAQLLIFFGVERGMTALDVIAGGGYITEALAVAVGPTGKVYLQNPNVVLQMQNSANAKAVEARLANNRLPNVIRVDGDLTSAVIPAGSVDVALTAMNLHDVYNRDIPATQVFLKNIYTALKPGGVLGVVDHAGVAGADNARLHRMLKQQAIDAAKQAGFVVEAESNLLANPNDDHTKGIFDASLRGKTDQFTLRLRKPKA